MKIVVEDKLIGKFEWTLPDNLSEHFAECGQVMRTKMGLSEEKASIEEKAVIERINLSINMFLSLIIGALVVGGTGSLMIWELIRRHLNKMRHTAARIAKKG